MKVIVTDHICVWIEKNGMTITPVAPFFLGSTAYVMLSLDIVVVKLFQK